MNLLPFLLLLGLILNSCQPSRQTLPPAEVATPLPPPPTEEERKRKDPKEIQHEAPKDQSIHGKTEAVQHTVNKAWSATIRYQHIIQEDKQ